MKTIINGGHQAGEKLYNRTLIEHVGIDKFGKHTWKWKCELCQQINGPHNYHSIKASANRKCQKCLCIRHHVNEKIGNRTLIKQCAQTERSGWLWEWRCDLCGSTHGPSKFDSIKKGSKSRCQSCMTRGKSQGDHKIGEKYNHKILVEYCGFNSNKFHLWKWRCELCNEIYGPEILSHLKRTGQCRDCTNKYHLSPLWKGFKDISGRHFFKMREGARDRNLEFTVTIEYLWEIWEQQQGLCVYTGTPLTHGVNASVDRIDNVLGYIPGNVQWVHENINRLKHVWDNDQFINMCIQVAEYQVKLGRPKNVGRSWDVKKWAFNYDRCVSCGSIDKRHGSRGRCVTCYDRDRYRDQNENKSK